MVLRFALMELWLNREFESVAFCLIVNSPVHLPLIEEMVAFTLAARLAAAVAVPVKAVCGTRRGIRGTTRLPSHSHSTLASDPQTLH